MLLALAKLIGWLIAHCPEWILRAFSWTLGQLCYHGYRSRQRVMLHSLRCSFPERTEAWRRQVAQKSCIRLMETALLSLAAPFIPEERIRRMTRVPFEASEIFAEHERNPRPIIIGTAHFAYWEGLTWLPLFMRRKQVPEVITIFRPLRNPKLDAWLRATRERFGVKLMSRSNGLHAALHVLQRNGMVSLLIDQSAGSHGFLTEFLGRECSTSPLPGMLVEKSGADVALVYTRRTAFWRFSIEGTLVETAKDEKAVTIALNRKLENLFRTDEELCASWLWLHQRWRILDRPGELQKLVARRGGRID